MASEEEPPWWSKFPEPTVTPQMYSKENLLGQFQIFGDILNAGTLIIDVRSILFVLRLAIVSTGHVNLSHAVGGYAP